jgi:hypothetical protein
LFVYDGVSRAEIFRFVFLGASLEWREIQRRRWVVHSALRRRIIVKRGGLWRALGNFPW